MKGGVGSMVKIWGGSSRRTVKGAANRSGAMLRTNAGTDDQNAIDYDTFLTWYTEYNLAEAAGNERNEPRTYSQKRKTLKFLSL